MELNLSYSLLLVKYEVVQMLKSIFFPRKVGTVSWSLSQLLKCQVLLKNPLDCYLVKLSESVVSEQTVVKCSHFLFISISIFEFQNLMAQTNSSSGCKRSLRHFEIISSVEYAFLFEFQPCIVVFLLYSWA